MERHLLLTMGGDGGESWNLRFVAGFFRRKAALRLTLFYVVPDAYASGPGEVILSDAQMRQGLEQLARARRWAVEHGFVPEHVETRAVPRQFGVVRDIVEEAHKGLYDAVVSGRRYLGWLEQTYTTSVSRGLLGEEIAFPLWVCHQPEPDLSNVLLCVDGSGENLRMADHVGFMLAAPGAEDHAVTLLHCREPGNGPGRADHHGQGEGGVDDASLSGEEAIAAAREAVLANGVDASRVRVLMLDACDCTGRADKAEAILRVAEQDRYAVVAVGRRTALPDTLMRRMFGRSVSERLHDRVNRFSLWVSK
ncbi:universal stress protein [Nitratidesulfovibrio sp. SRB-5]|uniref:universal stress protein n=1 Tax=Nitratidesulfovibrio sp. SRB-5 TaxID=2872636 RepID=UPI001025A72F|nr:universal stress protein [Nitratidesulfovibrio sp. SRB-5]MBZ2170949.1 universal stress protein [Nitratidesulfovibrio sp. SRB-5]RXF77864.1 universal stress protein [Desulfovibrio sp. DS-1]